MGSGSRGLAVASTASSEKSAACGAEIGFECSFILGGTHKDRMEENCGNAW
jgi:hypothetical protein